MQPTTLENVLFDVADGISKYWLLVPEEYEVVKTETTKGEFGKDSIAIFIKRR